MARIEMNETALMAGNGAAETLYNLGMMYCIGRDVEIDLISALKWLNLAALKGSESAKERRAELAAEMSSHEIAEAQRQARKWLTVH